MTSLHPTWKPPLRGGAVLALVLLLCGVARAEETLLDAARSVQARARELVERSVAASPDPTWGQTQAREDLGRLASAAGALAAAMESGDTGVTPRALKPGTERLEGACTRVRMSLPLLALPEGEAGAPPFLEDSARLATALRRLDGRFLGLAQVRPPHLGALGLEEAFQPLAYENPGALFREARALRDAAERMLASAACHRGTCRPGALPGVLTSSPWEDRELRDLVRAAYDFEGAAGSRYDDVQTTWEPYLALDRAFARVNPFWSGSSGDLAARELDRALRRLEGFYRQLGNRRTDPAEAQP